MVQYQRTQGRNLEAGITAEAMGGGSRVSMGHPKTKFSGHPKTMFRVSTGHPKTKFSEQRRFAPEGQRTGNKRQRQETG